MKRQPPRKVDTDRLDASAAAALNKEHPPERGTRRAQQEMWARLGQIRPNLQDDGLYSFPPTDLGHVLMGIKRSTLAGEDHKAWSYVLQDLRIDDSRMRYDPDGTFYNISDDSRYVIHPVKAVWRSPTKLKLLSIQEAGKRTSDWKRLEPVHDDYVLALGQLRHVSLHGRKMKYRKSFRELDRKMICLLRTLADLLNEETHKMFRERKEGSSEEGPLPKKKPGSGRHKRRTIRHLLKDPNMQYILGFETAEYWKDVERFSLPPHELELKRGLERTLTWQKANDERLTYVKDGKEYPVPRELLEKRDRQKTRTVLSAVKLVERVWQAAQEVERVFDAKAERNYNVLIRNHILPFVFSIYSHTHPMHPMYRSQFRWSDDKNDYRTAPGRHLMQLHRVAGFALKYWGQEPFRRAANGSEETLLESYENTWKQLEDFIRNVSKPKNVPDR